MLFKGIHRKPKAVREQYAFWSAVGITGCIALLWAVTLQYRLNETAPSNFVDSEHEGAFAQFLGEARTRAAAVFGSFEEPTVPAATSTEVQPATSSEERRPVFELTPAPHATTSAEQKPAREVRIAPGPSAHSSAETE